MKRAILPIFVPLWISAALFAAEPRVVFEDKFDAKLGDGWAWLRENPRAWRIKDGGLEIRVEPGLAGNVKNALLRPAPDRGKATYAIEATITFTAPPTNQYEQAGITWYQQGKPVFKLVHEHIDGKDYVIPGKAPAPEKTVRLRLLVAKDKYIAQFQPGATGEFKTAFSGKLAPGVEEQVSIQCYNGPADGAHWVRFDDFRIAIPRATLAEQRPRDEIKAYCIDFNWGEGGPNGFARPGLWADADPAQHVAWYKALGANVMQTFCVSCNGFAWYKHGVVPEQPGLKHDFLPEAVRLGHKEGMRVMGYFCIGSNTKWGKDHPDLSYGFPSSPHIPYTDEYLAYLSGAIRDAVGKTGIDGFMIDWVWQPERKATGGRWLDCEKKLYAELMGDAFPGEDKLTGPQEVAYSRKAIERCWIAVHKAAKDANPACIIWLSISNPTHPHVVNSRMYKEIDWLMNEGGDMERVKAVQPMIGDHTRLITCLANWNAMEPTTIVPAALKEGIGLYGFTKPQADSLVPLEPCLVQPVRKLHGDARNIGALARAYHGVSLDSVKNQEGAFVVEPR